MMARQGAIIIIYLLPHNVLGKFKSGFSCFDWWRKFYAIKVWFLRNHYNEGVVQVLNVELDSQKENPLLLSLPEEFHISFCDNPSTNRIRMKYLSIFSEWHYLLPHLFNNFNKVVVLEDDVVIQQDLFALWNIIWDTKLTVQCSSAR